MTVQFNEATEGAVGESLADVATGPALSASPDPRGRFRG